MTTEPTKKPQPTIGLRMSDFLRDEVIAAATAEKRSMNQMVNILVEEALRARGQSKQ